MLIFLFLVKMLIDFYITVLLLYNWMQWTHCDFYNPFSQFIFKIIQPIVRTLRLAIPFLGSFDSTSLLLAFIFAIIKVLLLMLMKIHVLILNPIYVLFSVLVLLKAIGKLIFWVVLVRSLLSGISQSRSPMYCMLYQLSEPLMYPLRRILPVVRIIDLSALSVIMILYVLNYLIMELFPELWYHL